MPKKKTKNLRKFKSKTFTLATLIENIGTGDINVDGKRVKTTKPRYRLYAKGTQCVMCGVQGTELRFEHGIHNSGYFDLYTAAGVRLDVDHIFPKSLGGGNCLRNYRLTCRTCNSRLGNDYPSLVDRVINQIDRFDLTIAELALCL